MKEDIEVERVKVNIYTNFQEVFHESEVNAKDLSSWIKKGVVRELTPKLYSAIAEEEPSSIINRNWDHIIQKFYPGSIISHRSALLGKPPAEKDVYLTASFTKLVELPGLTLHFKQGHPQVKGDYIYINKLFVSQPARAYLENMQTHSGSEINRTVPVEDVDQRLDTTIRMKGEQELKNIRVKAEELAHKFGMEREFEKLNVYFTNLLGPKKTNELKSNADAKPKRKFKRRLGP